MTLTMKSSGVYLVIYLFGWSCAVFSYSDLIYPKPKVVSDSSTYRVDEVVFYLSSPVLSLVISVQNIIWRHF